MMSKLVLCLLLVRIFGAWQSQTDSVQTETVQYLVDNFNQKQIKNSHTSFGGVVHSAKFNKVFFEFIVDLQIQRKLLEHKMKIPLDKLDVVGVKNKSVDRLGELFLMTINCKNRSKCIESEFNIYRGQNKDQLMEGSGEIDKFSEIEVPFDNKEKVDKLASALSQLIGLNTVEKQ